MTTFAEAAYLEGQKLALEKFANPADSMINMLGAVNPGAAAVGAGFTAPEGYGMGHAARTGLGAAGGQHLGGTAGEALGRILATVLKQNPDMFAAGGKAIGNAAGGAVGAHAGQTWANNAMHEDMASKMRGE